MPRKKETITLSIPPGTKQKLEAIASRLGFFWGKSPSPSAFITAIAENRLEVGEPFTLNSVQITALRQAIKDLIDTGHIEQAQVVTALLLERANLETPLRQALAQQVGQPTEAWRIRVNQLIEAKQPFHLSYGNSQGQNLEYTVRFAQITLYEQRMYLQVWCEETEDSNDIPELLHNRCLRLDRIKSIFPIDGEWRGRLDTVEVQLHFSGWLVKAYQPKSDDIKDQVIDGVRQVTRKVSNPFWLDREISRYWGDCLIIAPNGVRDRFLKKLKLTIEQYANNPPSAPKSVKE